MLYVFQVDTGRMMTFDMSLALESVANLKLNLEPVCHIPADKQVLLISGGECLNSEHRVCAYPTGTDTNPIFLFSKGVIDCDEPPIPCIDNVADPDMSAKVVEATNLPPSYSTVQKRTHLAKLFHDLGEKQLRLCEKLVHEQHIQQQGWAAVVANLEDLSVALKKRWNIYEEVFQAYISQRNSYLECLRAFKDDLLLLQKIPLLPALIETQKLHVPEMKNDEDENECEVKDGMTLLDWISHKDNFMDCLYEICARGLNQINENDFKLLHDEVNNTLAMTNDLHMKEIKGLGDRLFGLEELMVDFRRCVQEQADLAKSFDRNNIRATQVREPSVLPDLCATHIQQLNVLGKNHQHLCDITRRCKLAKEELSNNLFLRLKWIVFVEGHLCELDNKLVFKFQNLRSLQSQLEVLEQVHTAPATYLNAVAEVIRRRHFSQSFLMWASDVACNLLTIYTEEVTRRKEFKSWFQTHFLSSLFPGMEDVPPAFATQAPSIFDSDLPKLTVEDKEKLAGILPEMVEHLNVAEASLTFFLPKDSVDKSSENKAVEEKLIEVVNQAGLASNIDQNLLKAIEGGDSSMAAQTTPTTLMTNTTPHGLPHLKDLDRGCESETDTEEFEKVGQSPFDLNFDKNLPSPRPGTQDASTLTEDNLQISRSEHERIKSVLVQFAQLCTMAHDQLKAELFELKNRLLNEKTDLQQSVNNITINLNKMVVERERECIQRITVDHELEISDFRKISQGKNEEIKSLRDANQTLNIQLNEATLNENQLKERLDKIQMDSNRDIEEWKRKLDEIQLEKEKQLRDLSEELTRKHKNEMETMRARFKLMTMERSPSENSLEKIERGGEFISTETILLQMKENFESEKEVAVSDAVNKEDQKWQKLLADKIKENEMKFEEEKSQLLDEVGKRISREKDKQIDALREQMRNLSLECVKYKSTIQQLTEQRDDGQNDLMKTIDRLEKQNSDLQMELEKYRMLQAAGGSTTSAMAASVAVCEGAGTSDVATSPIKLKRFDKRTGDVSIKSGKLTTDSCKAGDLVIVVWDTTYKNFKIVQESSYLYFLNSDSFESLCIKIEDGKPNKTYCFAEVVEKEYCHARKDEQFSVVFQPTNRFRVPQGTKFFRVKAKATAYYKELPLMLHQSVSGGSGSTSVISTTTSTSSTTTTIAAAFRQSHMSQSQTTASVDIVCSDEQPSKSLPSSPMKVEWDSGKSEMILSSSSPQPSPIIEEKGEDSINMESDDVENNVTIDEKGTELTENFNVEIEMANHVSIDR